MDSAREQHLRDIGWLGSCEAAEVWAALDEARAQIERLKSDIQRRQADQDQACQIFGNFLEAME